MKIFTINIESDSPSHQSKAERDLAWISPISCRFQWFSCLCARFDKVDNYCLLAGGNHVFQAPIHDPLDVFYGNAIADVIQPPWEPTNVRWTGNPCYACVCGKARYLVQYLGVAILKLQFQMIQTHDKHHLDEWFPDGDPYF